MRLTREGDEDIERSLADQDVSINALSSITGIDIPALRAILSGEVIADPRHMRMIRRVLGDDFDAKESETPNPKTTHFKNNRPPEGWEIKTSLGSEIEVGNLIAYSRNSGQLWIEVTEITDDARSVYRGDPYVRIDGVDKPIRLASDRLYRIARQRGAQSPMSGREQRHGREERQERRDERRS